MARVDECRDQAAECLDSARRVADRKAKLQLLALAKGYLDLADLLEASESELEISARRRRQGKSGHALAATPNATVRNAATCEQLGERKG